MKVIYTSLKTFSVALDSSLVEFFPEDTLTVVEQLNYEPSPGTEIIVTNCPFILAKYDMSCVSVYSHETDSFEPVQFQTYGADFSIILKSLENVKSLTPRSVIEKIRAELEKSDSEAYEFIKNKIGSSGERAYLLKKLAKN